MINIIIIIFIFIFRFSFFLNKLTNPNPAFINNPLNKAPKDKPLIIYNSLKTTLLAQLGITPMILLNKGAKYLLFCKKIINFASPNNSIYKPKIKLTINT